MKKILIFGRSCAGKSSLASKLGNKFGLPIFHMDKMFWLPGWVEGSKQEMAVNLEKILTTHDSWVIEGNYKKVALESRIRSADLIIMLDFNVFKCLYRSIKRNFIHYNKTRPDMGEGCKEKLLPDPKFLKFIYSQRKSTIIPIQKILTGYQEKTILNFKNQHEVDVWLETL